MLILIGGVSRSGKSSLAKSICQNSEKAIHLDMDDFVLPQVQIPQVNGTTDWETPLSIDWKRLNKLVTEQLSMRKTVVVDGIFAFCFPPLFQKSNLNIYIELNEQTFYERRKVETRWGKEEDWYLKHVWEAHKFFGNPYSIQLNIKSPDLQLAKQKACDFLS